MSPFPLLLTEILGKPGAYLIYLLIGFAFGFVLEISGFGYSPKLAAQFYFKELTVLKVMFTGIVVAMLGIFFTTAIGLLDYNLIWVNPTYLWPGILGGFIMGFGFIIGGFCPGTSLVASATAKIDGLFFTFGTLFGIFIFGETIDLYPIFWNSSYLGRFTLPEWLGIPTGWVLVIVVLMALFMFWGGEQLERIIGGMDISKAPKIRYLGGAALVVFAVIILAIGQPSTDDRWQRIANEKVPLLDQRAYQIHPGELLHTMHDPVINLIMLDVRSEADYNMFHILDAQHMPPADLPDMIDVFHLEPANTVFVVMSNDEGKAIDAWKTLVAESVPNVYILEGGINNWLEIFSGNFEQDFCAGKVDAGYDELRYEFTAALGAGCPAAYPDEEDYELEFEDKIELELKRAPTGGGCG